MITTLDIIGAVSTMMKEYVKCKIFLDENELQTFKGNSDCIFINVTPLISQVATKHTNEENIIIDIQYFPVSLKKADLYPIDSLLRRIFTRSININDNYIHINNIASDFIEDSIGWKLNFSMTSKFHNLLDPIESNNEVFENIEKIIIN